MTTFNIPGGLAKSIAVLFLFFLVIAGLHFSKEFFVPVTIAGMLAMLFLPLSRWFEKKGMNKALAAVLCIFLLLLLLAGIVVLISFQVSSLAEDSAKMEQQITGSLNKLRSSISTTLGISKEKQDQMMKEQQSSSSGKGLNMVAAILAALSGIMVDFILVMVYIFLFMFFRGHLKKFILKIVKPEARPETEIIIRDSSRVTQKYLGGLGMMILSLWIMYGIGYSIVGVKNAIFFAVLCGLLEIVPFVGNITGTALTLLMVVTQGGDGKMIAGVLVTYAVVQFIQTYLLEPMVVGSEVNINPLFTIMVIVLGEMIWGIPGMILAIPLLGIAKIICDHVEGLKPYGFLIGKEEGDNEKGGFKEKLKKLLPWKK